MKETDRPQTETMHKWVDNCIQACIAQ